MEITLNYSQTLRFAQTCGNQALLEALDRKCSILAGRELKLYSISLNWQKDSSFILKARGGAGDVLVLWER